MTGNVADQPLIEQKTLLTRRNFLCGSALTAAGFALYAGEIARHEISVLTRPIAIGNLPSAFNNFRIAQISDIHFEGFTEPSFLRRVIDQINSLQADVTLLTGDFVTMTPLGRKYAEAAMRRCLGLLRGIKGPRFACMGNHDSILGAPMLRPIFASYDIPLLMNANLPIERQGQRLWLCGVGDYLTEVPNLDLALPVKPDGPVLLMCHAPDYADAVVSHPRGHLVDFMMSGHSHGGQVRLPFLGALHTPNGALKYIEGLFRVDQMQLYVNRGVGTVGVPFRLNCPPEISLFTLQRA